MMSLTRCLFFSAALVAAASTPVESHIQEELTAPLYLKSGLNDDASHESAKTFANVTIYTSGRDKYSGYWLTSVFAPVLYSGCGRVINWEFVHFGMTQEDTSGKFTCVGGEKNCEWLETMNCLNDLVKKDPESKVMPWIAAVDLMSFNLLGRHNVTSLQLLSSYKNALHVCIKSGTGAKLMHEAGVRTREEVKLDDEKFDVTATINGVQMPEIYAEDIFSLMCNATKGVKQCCQFPSAGLPSSSGGESVIKRKDQQPFAAKITRKPELRGSFSIASGAAANRQFFPFPASSLSSSPEPLGNITLYDDGSDFLNYIMLLYKVAPVAFSPCGEKIRWDMVYYGNTTETSPYNFQCPGDAANCKRLIALNCVDRYVDHHAQNIDIFRSQLILSILGRGGVEDIREFLLPNIVADMDHCIKSGEGLTLLHKAGVKTRADINYPPDRISLAVSINGKQEEEVFEEGFIQAACKATKAKECCHSDYIDKIPVTASVDIIKEVFQQQLHRQDAIIEV